MKQGFPDRLILFEDKWAAFDAKASNRSSHRPNQDYWVDLLDSMSFAAFVYPENKEEFFNDLQQAFRSNRTTRIPKR